MKASESKYHDLAVIDPGQPMLFKFWDGSLNLDVSQNKMSFFVEKEAGSKWHWIPYLFIHIYIYIYIYISIKKLKWQNNGNGSGSNQNVLLQYNFGALLSEDKLWINSWWMFYFTVWSITSIVPSTPTTTWERFYSSYSHLQPGRDVVQINEQVGWSTKLDEGNTYNKHMRLHWEIPVRLSFRLFVCFLRIGLSQLRRWQCYVSSYWKLSRKMFA